MAENAKWYVVHTYSGYENTVAASIMKAAENRQMQDLIQEVNIPLETVVEHTDGGDKEVERKVFPGYVLVKMVLTDESWHLVRNSRGCTGFVGPGSKPEPLSEAEVERMGVEVHTETKVDFAVGDNVEIVAGPLEGFVGLVKEIDTKTRKVKVEVSMFGRDTSAELDLAQVKTL